MLRGRGLAAPALSDSRRIGTRPEAESFAETDTAADRVAEVSSSRSTTFVAAKINRLRICKPSATPPTQPRHSRQQPKRGAGTPDEIRTPVGGRVGVLGTQTSTSTLSRRSFVCGANLNRLLTGRPAPTSRKDTASVAPAHPGPADHRIGSQVTQLTTHPCTAPLPHRRARITHHQSATSLKIGRWSESRTPRRRRSRRRRRPTTKKQPSMTVGAGTGDRLSQVDNAIRRHGGAR